MVPPVQDRISEKETSMKAIEKMGAQGDVLFRRVASVPKGAVRVKRKGPLVIAFSETHHHHTVDDAKVTQFDVPVDPLVCYLQLGDSGIGGADVVHQRAWDTHETLRLLGGAGDVWEVRRQREWTPEGWRRVQD